MVERWALSTPHEKVDCEEKNGKSAFAFHVTWADPSAVQSPGHLHTHLTPSLEREGGGAHSGKGYTHNESGTVPLIEIEVDFHNEAGD